MSGQLVSTASAIPASAARPSSPADSRGDGAHCGRRERRLGGAWGGSVPSPISGGGAGGPALRGGVLGGVGTPALNVGLSSAARIAAAYATLQPP